MSTGARPLLVPAGAAGSASKAAGEAPDPWLVKIRDLIYKVAGIFQPDHKFGFLKERCDRRITALKLASFRQYHEVLTGPSRTVETPLLLNEITVGETCFFRNPPQLEALRRIVLPKILKVREKNDARKLRLWSAGCSTGEEPYTLAIILLEESAGLLKGCDFEIMATDLNDRSIDIGQEGIYDSYALRNTSPEYVKKYFKPANGHFEISPAVRSKVKFQRVNLLEDAHLLFLKNMDVIFCCNVLIYFDTASKQRVISHFFHSLLESGYLFLGHAESLYGVSDAFQLAHFPCATGYIKGSRKDIAPQAGKP